MAIIRRTIFAAASAASINLASVPAGRLMVAFAYRDGNNTAPTLPAGWINIDGTGANTNSARVAYRISDGAEGTPTFTNASTVIVLTYEATVGAIGVGGFAVASGASTSVSYPAVTMQDAGGSSWLAAFAGHRSVNTALETPPAGFALLSNPLDATDEAAAFDTGGGVTGYGGEVVSVGGTSSGWRSAVVEITEVLPIEATVASTLAPATVSATAALNISATISASFEAATVAATGTLSDAAPGLAGEIAVTLGAATLESTGALAVTGQVTAMLAPATVASAAQLDLTAQAATVLAEATLSSSARIAITGQVGGTLGPATVEAVGQLLSPVIEAAASATLGPATVAAAGRLAVSAQAGGELAGLTLTSAGQLMLSASVTGTLGAVTASAVGTIARSRPPIEVAGSWPALRAPGVWTRDIAVAGQWPGLAVTGIWRI